MQISDCRVWTGTAKGEERVCREKSSELCVWVGVVILWLFNFLYPYVLFIRFRCSNINKLLLISLIYELKVLYSNPTPATYMLLCVPVFGF